MKFSYNANGLRGLTLQAAIAEVAAAGYDGIEFSLHPTHLMPGAAPSVVSEVTRWIAASGLAAPSLATGGDLLMGPERFEPSLVHPTSEGRESRLDFIGAAIELARALGVPVVSFASGIRRAEVTLDEAWDHLRRGVERLLTEAAGDPVLAIEPEPGFLVESNDQALTLLSAFDTPALRLNQDVGHSRVVEEDYLGAIARAMPWTSHLHVEDIKGRVHHHEIPGDGELDFGALFGILGRAGYPHFVSVELYNHGDRYREALNRSLVVLRQAAESSPRTSAEERVA